MNRYIEELVKGGLGNIIDKHVDEEIMEDSFYNDVMEGAQVTKEKLEETLNEEQKALLEDYIACIFSANARVSNISYLVGLKDTIKFMSGIGLFNDSAKE